FLFNRRYKPFYKWMHRAVRELPVLGKAVHELLSQLAGDEGGELSCLNSSTKVNIIEDICRLLREELKAEGLSDSESTFLLDHGPLVQAKINDEELRNQNVWLG
ncbi:MAG TPA: hypothetical protein VHO84_04700, partial [Syntrophorhabdaceae bacterium]|nr:hypothetical protein [Syntrophorhabdaceae bacterium]